MPFDIPHLTHISFNMTIIEVFTLRTLETQAYSQCGTVDSPLDRDGNKK